MTIDYYNSRSRLIYKDTNSKEPVKIKDATQIVRQLNEMQTKARPAIKSTISLTVHLFFLLIALTD